MPRPPGIIDRVNYLIDMWERPCGESWWVYARTALPAALDLVVFLLCFDLGDVIRWFFRPGYAISREMGASGRFARLGGHHGGLSRGGRKHTPSLLRRATDKLPGMKRLRMRQVTKGVMHLWVIDGILQRILWYWLLVEGISGFLYNWTSILYRTEACRTAFGPSVGRESEPDLHIGGMGTHDIIIWRTADPIGEGWWLTDIHTTNGLPALWHIALATTLTNTHDDPAHCQIAVGIQEGEQFRYQTSDWTDIGPHSEANITIDIIYTGTVNAMAYVQNYGASLILTTGLMLIWEQGAPEGPPVELDCKLRDVLSL